MKNNLFFIEVNQLILVILFFIFWPKLVLAGPAEYQRCKTDNVCVIGEFLYDDEYDPIATASCTLTSHYPNGTLFLNSVVMTAETDGWYFYSFDTSNKPEGLYRSQMCCTATPDYLCLDKSFYIGPSFMSASEAAAAVWNAQTASFSAEGTFGKNLQNPVLTAADIWNYTNRTLSSFGTLVADIWNYTSRTLTNFGTLIADMWGFGNRTLTSENLDNGKNLATEEKVNQATESATISIKGSANKDLTQLSGEVAVLAGKIDSLSTSINQILSKWGSYSAIHIYDKVKNLSSEIAAINQIPNIDSLTSLININIEKDKKIMNKLLAMEAILKINRSLLEGLTTEPVIKTWIEEGSIIFKTLVYNPSNEKKTVKIKYYLPSEFKKENLIKKDEELIINFDPKENTYYYQGEIELKPQETRIFSIETEDVWKISKEEIVSLRHQAEQLFDPLKNTAFYAQGAVLKSDIDVGLDKVWLKLINAYTPEERIKAYREASVELAAVKEKIDSLKNLLAQTSSSRSLFGFIGGVATTVSWAIVLIFLIGFSILFYYFQKIKKQKDQEEEKTFQKETVIHHRQPRSPFPFGPFIFFILFIFGLTIGILIAYDSQNRMMTAKKTIERLRLTPYVQKPTIVLSPPPIVEKKTQSNASSEAVLGSTASEKAKEGEQVMIVVPTGSYLNLRATPSLKGDIIGQVKKSVKANLLAEIEGWKKVRFYSFDNKKEIEGWLAAEFVKKP